MIRFEHVTKRLGGRLILQDISLEIEEKETLVIVGFSGAGKSVSLRHMVRLLTPDSGRVWIGDKCVSSASGKELEEIRARFGYLFQGSALLQWLTVGDNVGLPLRERLQMPEDQVLAEVTEKLGMVNLSDAIDRFPAELSGGMRKRAALARAIITAPDIILYDEPTSGLDPVTSRTIDRLIDSLRKEIGVTWRTSIPMTVSMAGIPRTVSMNSPAERLFARPVLGRRWIPTKAGPIPTTR